MNRKKSPPSVGLLCCIVVPLLCLPIHILSKLLIGSGNLCIVVCVPILRRSIVVIAGRLIVVTGLGLRGRRRIDHRLNLHLLVKDDPRKFVLRVKGSYTVKSAVGGFKGVVDRASLQFEEL
jgi:hypothetical protein